MAAAEAYTHWRTSKSIKGKAYIAGIYEHPTRKAPDKSVAQLHAESARGALADAGLSLSDVDGHFCAGDAPGPDALSMVEYMGLSVRHVDTTETGGSSYLIHVSHAAQASAAGKCDIALVSLGGRRRSEGHSGAKARNWGTALPDVPYEAPCGPLTLNQYAMPSMRHMHQCGTTAEQLAWIKVAVSHHAQHNPNAMLRDVVSVADVLDSPMVADPLHRLDCCVVSDGGGALVVTRPEIARGLGKPLVPVLGAGEAPKGLNGGPAEHWVRFRTTNPIESSYATMRLRTKRTRNCGSCESILTMVFKLLESAQRGWRRIPGSRKPELGANNVPSQDGESHPR